jgi:hypothetical protein
MAKFFIPGSTPKRSEEIYSWIVRYVKAMIDCEIEPVRIYSLAYSYEGRQFTATVGEEEPRTRQLVIAILRSKTYLICTPYYGVRRGEPMEVSFSDVSEIQYFEGIDRARETLKTAVKTLDDGSLSFQSQILSAATMLDAVLLDDFPPIVSGDFFSLKHKLMWRGNRKDTIFHMSDAEAADAALAIKGLYVDVIRLSLESHIDDADR